MALSSSITRHCVDLGKIFNDSSNSDVTIECGGKKFNCHKAILCARSDVFNAMISHKNMIEAMTNTVTITDMEPDTVELLLRFLYTDKVGGSGNVDDIFKLFIAADKYNVRDLKTGCNIEKKFTCEKQQLTCDS